MPELPEVETVRRSLEQLVIGQTVTGVSFGAFPGVVRPMDPVVFSSLISGATIVKARRRAKYLFLDTDSPMTIQVHLMMTGRLLVVRSDTEPVRFEHLRLHLSNGMDIRFADQRKFGHVRLLDDEQVQLIHHRLGPEPLERGFTAAYLHSALAARSGKIKNALLDQQVVAGLGNIYVDEALYRSRIHPESISRCIPVEAVQMLVRQIRSVLRTAIENQGTTFSSFENPYGERGRNADSLLIYGKGGKDVPCAKCGSLIVRLVVGGRGTSVCSTCQVLHLPVIST